MYLSIDISRAEFLGTSGPDTIHGTDDLDFIYGYGGHDRLFGYAGDDFLHGGGGRDVIEGGLGNDTLAGGHGNDWLRGGAGLDAIDGGAGDDILVGGGHSDFMFGGSGADIFRILPVDIAVFDAWGDAIGDFDQSEHDRLDLRGLNKLGGQGDIPLVFIGTAAFSGNGGEVRYAVVGNETYVEIDILGYSNPSYGGNGDYQLFMTGALALAASDFLL